MSNLRSKAEILGNLNEVVTDNDKKICKSMYHASGSLVMNKKKDSACGASYVGWGRTDKGELVRFEGEPRGEGASASLVIKMITVPNITGVDLGLEEPRGEDFRNKGVKNFFDTK